VEVTIKSPALPQDLKNLKELLSSSHGKKGRCQLYLRIEAGGALVDIATGLSVEPSSDLIGRVEGLIGKGTVKIS
jgi:hypothetical protein